MTSLVPRSPLHAALAALAATALLSLSACSPGGRPGIPPEGDGEDFVSASPDGASDKSSGEAGAPSAGGDDRASDGTPRTVEEGDVFRLVGDTLYVLNAYRGLQIVDVSDRARPVLLGASPIFGHPVEMYLRDGFAYVVVSDYFTYWRVADGASSFHGSQVRVVDVRHPEAPVVIGEFAVNGFVSDTRIVGDVLYVVSNRWAYYSHPGSDDVRDELFVSSIDLSAPHAPLEVETLSFPGSSHIIHVSPSRLYVASPGGDWNDPITDVTLVDIDDPAGDLAIKGSLRVAGSVDRRFQLDEHAGTFRVVSHWGGWGQDGSQRLSVFDIRPGEEKLLSSLDLPNTGGLYATRFAGDRAYVVTMITVDPLEIIDLTDPENPVLTHVLEIPGVLHHIEPRGDRLLALGTDERWSGVTASLFDVADPFKPALLARVPVGGNNSWSNANWDDKALRVLDDKGMMLVPFTAWNQGDKGQWSYTNGFQIIDFDRSTLKPRGIVEQEGQVSRVFGHRDGLLSLSDRVLQAVEIADRDRPGVEGKLELARDVSDLAVAEGRLLTLSTSGWYWDSEAELRITSPEDPEGAALGRIALPFRAARVLPDEDGAVVLGWPYEWDGSARAVRVDLTTPENPSLGPVVTLGPGYRENEWASAYLEQAVVFGKGQVAVPVFGWRQYYYGRWATYSLLATADLLSGTARSLSLGGVISGDLLVVDGQLWTSHREEAESRDGRARARFFADRIELRGGAPVVAEKINVPGTLVGVAGRGSTLFTRDYKWNSDGRVVHALAEVTVSGGRAKLRAYVPVEEGLGRVFLRGRRLYATSQCWWWGQCDNWGEVTLRVFASTTEAPLREVSSQKVSGYLQLSAVTEGHLFLGTGYWGGPWELCATEGFARGGLADAPGRGYYASANGLLVYSLADEEKPALSRFVRTNGWVQAVRADANTAWISSGIYGIQRISLAP